jgi:rod shape-determining protein MreD
MTDDRFGVAWRGGVLIFAALVAQVVAAELDAFDAIADLMLLLPLAAGSLAGPDRGATFGFAAGLAYDLALLPDTPIGLSALVYAVVGYAVGVGAGWVMEPRWWFHVTLAVLGSILAMTLMVVIDQVLGSRYPIVDVVRATAVVAAWNAALILPARRAVGWALGLGRADRYDLALR